MTGTGGTFEYWSTGSQAYERLLGAKRALATADLPAHLLELVFLRVSQINGCRFCIALHSAAAVKAGATREQIAALNSWQSGTQFGDMERAALAWAESVTQIRGASGMEAARSHLLTMLTPRQTTDLTVAIGLMNALNRVAISLGRLP